MQSYTQAEKQLAAFLNVIAVLHAALYVVGVVGAYFGPTNPFFTQPPFASNAAAAMGLVALLAWFAAADVRRFRPLIYMLIGGFTLGAVGWFIFYLSPKGALQPEALVAGVGLAVIFGALLTLLATNAHNNEPAWSPWQPDKALTGWERLSQLVCLVIGVGAGLAVVVHFLVALGSFAGLSAFFTQPLMVGGSAIKIGLLAACLLLAARDMRRGGIFLTLFVLGNGASLVVVLATHLGINRFGVLDYPELGLTNRSLMLGALLLDFTVIAGFGILKWRINRSVIDHTRFFSPVQFRQLEAIAGTLVEGGDGEAIPPEAIVLRTDSYLGSFPSQRLWLAKLAVLGLELIPLAFALRPPISFMNPSARRAFMDQHFKQDIVNKRGRYGLLERLRLMRVIDIIEGMMRFNMQLSYIGYYSDRVVHQTIGYKPFSKRAEGQKARPSRPYPALNVLTPQGLRQRGLDTLTADVVIIGSGAAGAILAEQLAAQGREVLILEKGPYVHPDHFNEDEVDMISRLYSDGALQISQSLRFTVLQGSCVGGTTVVNNAVCFDTPDRVLAEWNNPNGLNAGLDIAAFRAAQQAVRQRLHIQSIRHSSATRPWQAVLNPGDSVIEHGVERIRAQANGQLEYDVIEANITDCLGCGYCNIGCKYGRKLSMLDEVLPAAQQTYGDQFRIVSEAQVVRLNGDGRRVTEVVARLRDGRRLTIQNPKTVVLSAGTIASSWLLMRSGVGRGELPVGKYLAFNMGSPLHGLWEQELNSYAGLQIAHYIRPAQDRGFVFETWYNPPVAQALAMPGWLDVHFQNMHAYNRMAAVGVLIGTEATAQLTRALFLPGAPDIVYTPTDNDLGKLVDALVLLGHILFEAGAQTIFASTRHYRAYPSGKGIYQRSAHYGAQGFDADSFERGLRELVKSERDILLGTGHPQGGNRMSGTRGRSGIEGGVVAPDFKVYGTENLYVCDASVFPGATTVNPQLTVMSMGHYAAGHIV
jgi:choline dehydrogenase-like flavoprotein